MQVLYFGTYERTYPRNAQVISSLRRVGTSVVEHHVPVWEGLEHKHSAAAGATIRIGRAQFALMWRRRPEFDAVIVGYPGHADVLAARAVARDVPVVFNPLLSLWDTFVADRGRFGQGSLAARALRGLDRAAIRLSDLVVADTEAHAEFLASLAGVSEARFATCFVGAEERLFKPGWRPVQPFTCLFVGKLIPLQGIETIAEAVRIAPDLRFRIVGSGQLDRVLERPPRNVERIGWRPYASLPDEYRAAGCALGIFGRSPKAQRVIPNKVFQALACGAPVVTADTSAARELLVHGESALLVPPGEPEALVEAVRLLRDDPPLAERIAEGGHTAYLERASEAVLGRRWLSLIRGAVERKLK